MTHFQEQELIRYHNLINGMDDFASAKYLRNYLDITTREAWELLYKLRYPTSSPKFS